MAKEPQYYIRDAGSLPNDTEFIAAAFDSTLPYLDSIGGGEMWGKVPFSERKGFMEETRDSIEESESYCQTGTGEKIRLFIAEVGVGTACPDELKETKVQTRVWEDGEIRLSVAATCIREAWVPEYVAANSRLYIPPVDCGGPGDYVYVEFLVADHRTGGYRKGAGAALLQQIQQHYKDKGFKTMYVDAWADNGRKLVRYYERLGFRAIDEFKMGRNDGRTWPGTVLQIDF
ncbi:acetyltransferase [Colletotrichum sublineola]|nr:acetyltransferase [Colletotrichum sublineola]